MPDPAVCAAETYVRFAGSGIETVSFGLSVAPLVLEMPIVNVMESPGATGLGAAAFVILNARICTTTLVFALTGEVFAASAVAVLGIV